MQLVWFESLTKNLANRHFCQFEVKMHSSKCICRLFVKQNGFLTPFRPSIINIKIFFKENVIPLGLGC